jgi:hypothetical protein
VPARDGVLEVASTLTLLLLAVDTDGVNGVTEVDADGVNGVSEVDADGVNGVTEVEPVEQMTLSSSSVTCRL